MMLGLDPENARMVWLWVGWLWPIALPLAFVLASRGKIQDRIAFLVIGALVCYGIQGITSRYMITLPAPTPENAALPEQLFYIMLAAIVRTNVVSFFLSFVPLTWLYVLLRTKPESSHTERTR
jgi:hypothetical protein